MFTDNKTIQQIDKMLDDQHALLARMEKDGRPIEEIRASQNILHILNLKYDSMVRQGVDSKYIVNQDYRESITLDVSDEDYVLIEQGSDDDSIIVDHKTIPFLIKALEKALGDFESSQEH